MDLYAEQAPQRAADNALRRHLDREDIAAKIEAEARDEAEQAILDAVKSGLDVTVAHYSLARGHAVESYPASSYLSECCGDAAQMLFAACHQAAKGDDAAAAHLLRGFVKKVAQDFGADNFEAYL